MRRFRLLATSAAALTLTLAATPAVAKKPLPEQCADGRFIVQGAPLIAGESTPTIEAVTLGTSVSITTGCAPVTAKLKRTKKGTTVKAAWTSCTGLPAKAKLSALVAAPACTTMTGTLTAPKTKPKKHPFTAVRSVCGDGKVDAGANEQCDGPGTCAVASDTCSDQCQCSSGSTTTSSTIAGTTSTSSTIVAGTTTTSSTSSTSSTIVIPTTTVTTIPVSTTSTRPTVSTTVAPTTSTSTSTSSTIPATPAVVELNEIAPNQTGSRDLIELHVVSGGTCKGITIEQAGFNAAIVLATLPDVVVATDDLIVVHLNPASGAGNPPGNETAGKAEFPAATYLTNYDGAWDFLGSPSGIVFGTRVLQVRSALGTLVDALVAARDAYNPPAGFIAALQAVQTAGVWLPADCSGSPCTDQLVATARDTLVVNWEGALGTTTLDATVARHAGAHTHAVADWAVGPVTLGAPNP